MRIGTAKERKRPSKGTRVGRSFSPLIVTKQRGDGWIAYRNGGDPDFAGLGPTETEAIIAMYRREREDLRLDEFATQPRDKRTGP